MKIFQELPLAAANCYRGRSEKSAHCPLIVASNCRYNRENRARALTISQESVGSDDGSHPTIWSECAQPVGGVRVRLKLAISTDGTSRMDVGRMALPGHDNITAVGRVASVLGCAGRRRPLGMRLTFKATSTTLGNKSDRCLGGA